MHQQSIHTSFYLLLAFILPANCRRTNQTTMNTQINREAIQTDTLLWNLESLYQAPEYRIVDSSTIMSVVFEGPVFNDTVREVFGYYSNPALLQRDENSDAHWPGVVLLHGGGGRAFKPWVQQWAAEGYAAIAIDLSARDGLKFFNKPSGPNATIANKFYNIGKGPQYMWQVFAVGAAVRAHSFLRNRPEVDASRTALTGISGGGYLTCITAAIDPRFNAAAPVYGCGYFDELTGPKPYFAKMPPNQIQTWLKYLDPKHYLPAVQCPVLFINSNKDFFFNIIPFHKSYSLIPDSLCHTRITPGMKHGHTHGWAPFEIRFFFNNQLKREFPLPEVGRVTISDSLLTARYHAPVPARKARLYYTADILHKNVNRVWKTIKARINGNTLSCKNPGEKMWMGFFYVTDERRLSVSSKLFFNPQYEKPIK